MATMTGKAVHRSMQVLCETGDEGDARNHLDTFLKMPKHEAIAIGTPEYDTVIQLFERGCEAHRSIVSEERWAELDTWVPSKKRGISVRTIVDRADRMSPTEWQIIDWKTGRADKPESVDRQLDIAHLVVRTARGLGKDANVTAIGWNLRTGERRVRAARPHGCGEHDALPCEPGRANGGGDGVRGDAEPRLQLLPLAAAMPGGARHRNGLGRLARYRRAGAVGSCARSRLDTS